MSNSRDNSSATSKYATRTWTGTKLLVMVSIIASTLAVTPVVASASTVVVSSSCELTAEHTPGSIVQSGVAAVVAAETVDFVNEVSLEPGTYYQQSIALPTGEVHYTSLVEIVSPGSDIVLDPSTLSFEVDGTVQTLTVLSLIHISEPTRPY